MPQPQPDAPAPPTHHGMSLKRYLLLSVGIVAVAAIGLAVDAWRQPIAAVNSATFVGRSACIECHAEAGRAFEGSHHDLAMDRATPETVLGNFDDAEMTHHGVTSRMFRRDNRYWIHTEGPDGKLADFEIKYVFGVTPLQQYLVEFDRGADLQADEIGRLQVLRISWDTVKKKWIYIPPPDVSEKLEPGDPLHWTGMMQCWNTMCADCHSTNFEKRFDVKELRYHSRFSEIDVSCEACHGPGSVHLEWARAKNPLWAKRQGMAIMRFGEESATAQIETCATCHSRRSVVDPHFRPQDGYYDHYSNELLEATSYFADGQILDEVYVYGSFLQSKMFHKGVKCTDCHDPHSVKLKYEGNRVCTSCHQHAAGKYDTPAHHHHKSGSPGSSCVECHIPETTYMEVDPRRDHSFRVPRPDLSVALGTPNACSRCHLDRAELAEEKKSEFKQYRDWVVAAAAGDADVKQSLAAIDAWSLAAVKKWYPQSKLDPSFAELLVRARRGDERVLRELVSEAGKREFPPIVRATMLQEAMRLLPPISPYEPLRSGPAYDFFALAQRWLNNSDPQLRIAAVRSFEPRIPLVGSRRLDPQAGAAMSLQLRPVVRLLSPSLDDEKRAVRVEAARVLQQLPPELRPDLLTTPQRERLAEVTKELFAQYDANSERGGAHLAKGIIYEGMARDEDAIAAYETAIRVEPTATGPRSNLASLLDRLAETERAAAMQLAQQRQRDAAVERLMKEDKYRSRALELRREELPLLARDAALAPNNAMIQHRYGLNLYLVGEGEAAEAPLRRAVELAPDRNEFVLVLATYYHKFGKLEQALELTKQLIARDPDNQQYQNLAREIQAALGSGNRETP